MGNKNNMKQIVIVLMGVLLIVSMVGGVLGEEVYYDIENRLTFEKLDKSRGDLPNTPVTSGEQMVGKFNEESFLENNANWARIDKEIKNQYGGKKTPAKFEGDMGENYKIDINGNLVDKDGKVAIDKDFLTANKKVVFNDNGSYNFLQQDGTDWINIDPTTGKFDKSDKSAPKPPPPLGEGPGERPGEGSNKGNGPGFDLKNGGLDKKGRGGGGGASSTPALDAFKEILSLVGQIQSLIPKQEDKIPPEEDPSSFAQGPGFAETYLASLKEGSVEVTKEGVTIDNGAIVGFQTRTQQTLVAGQTNLENPATIKEAGGNTIETNNLAFIRPNEVAAETTDSTTVEFNGIRGDSNFPSTSTSALLSLQPSFLERIKSLFPLNALITGKVIGSTGQSIQLINHDLNVDGHDMDIYPLKTFNNVEFGGNNLHLFNGNIHMAFNGQRIMYSRLVYNAPHGIKRIKNKLEINQNEFILQHYTDKSGELTDKNKIISVGDIIKSPRKGPYTKLKFNKYRINTIFS